jgi:hypothetical protein
MDPQEQFRYEMIGVFIPPQALWSRHPGFKDANRMLKRTEEPIPRDMQNKVCLSRLCFVLLDVSTLSQLKTHVEKTWRPNLTLVVRLVYCKNSYY